MRFYLATLYTRFNFNLMWHILIVIAITITTKIIIIAADVDDDGKKLKHEKCRRNEKFIEQEMKCEKVIRQKVSSAILRWCCCCVGCFIVFFFLYISSLNHQIPAWKHLGFKYLCQSCHFKLAISVDLILTRRFFYTHPYWRHRSNNND